MASRSSDPAKPTGLLEGAGGLRAVLLPRTWVAAGAVALILFVGLTRMSRFEGVEVLAWWATGPTPRSGAWDLADPALLLPLYGLAYLLAWPALLTIGALRRLIDARTRARLEPGTEGRRSRVQLLWMSVSIAAVAAAWTIWILYVLSEWEELALIVGWVVSAYLLFVAFVLIIRMFARVLRRSAPDTPS